MRYLRVSPQKARLVLAERGKNGELSTVVGSETAAPAPAKARRRAPAAKKSAGKKKAAAK